MNRKEYSGKLRRWEAEGYDVSELREKWFPAKKVKGGSHIVTWLTVIGVAVFIVVTGVVVWQASQPPAPHPTPPLVPAPITAPQTTTAPASTPAPPVAFTLNTTANPSGGGSVSPGSGTYDSNTRVTLTAVPSPGYQFDRWSGDASGTSLTITITMDSDKGIIANFSKIQYRLSTSVSPPGSGSVSPGNGTFDSGSQVTLTATSSPGWKFEHWGGDHDNDVNPTTVPMTGTRNVIAYFVAIDTDGDGLSDEEERRIGTNPGYTDTDRDGLNDYEEVKVKKTDPLSPDTDGDGVIDGDDLFPLYDAYLKVAINYFESTGTLGDEAGSQEAYFIITVNGEKERSTTSGDLIDGRYLNNPYSVTFNIQDEKRYISVSIAAWDSDFLFDDHYDINDSPELVDYETRYDITGGTFTATSDGAADGGLSGLQGKITVEISTVRR